MKMNKRIIHMEINGRVYWEKRKRRKIDKRPMKAITTNLSPHSSAIWENRFVMTTVSLSPGVRCIPNVPSVPAALDRTSASWSLSRRKRINTRSCVHDVTYNLALNFYDKYSSIINSNDQIVLTWQSIDVNQ